MQRPANLRPPQFGLRSLFVLTAAIALVFGLYRIAGNRIGLALFGALAATLPCAWRRRWFFVGYLPIVWTTVAWSNFFHPGDEYGGFAASSLAGLWILLVFDFSGNINHALPPVLLAGAATVSVFGWLLDKLRAPRPQWGVLFAIVAVSLFCWSFFSFPSVERALAKNGSYEAYILPSMNFGLYAATLGTLAGTGIFRLAQRLRSRTDSWLRFSSQRRRRL
ncbi:MAG TPA: hypothetical protein VHB99_06830 [Pirellulales bacterium]|nr:hypothetical protein [Pirellulales bacterium]